MTRATHRDMVLELGAALVDGRATNVEMAELERLLADDVVARGTLAKYLAIHGQLASTAAVLDSLSNGSIGREPQRAETSALPVSREKRRPRTSSWTWRATLATTVACSAVVAICLPDLWKRDAARPVEGPRASTPVASDYDNTPIDMHPVAFLAADQAHPIPRSTVGGATHSLLETVSRAEVWLDEEARVAITGASEVLHFSGDLSVRAGQSQQTFAVELPGLRVVGHGNEFRIAHLADDLVEIATVDGVVEVQRRSRLPRYFWQFSEAVDGRVLDRTGQLSVTVSPAVEVVQGPTGGRALSFANEATDAARISGDDSLALGEGPFACASGISIEAVVVCRWTAAFRDYDEIFRKEDGPHRMLLSFQNDLHDTEIPPVADGPVLSFGIHIDGTGYSELDMPLDGANGRPTVADLTDGRPHHIVATYDAFSGVKSLYVDGRLRFSHLFEPGSVILNGGPAPAIIGNWRNREPFNGLIEALGFFDFALAEEEVAERSRRLLVSSDLDSAVVGDPNVPRWIVAERIQAGTTLPVRFTR